LLFTEVPAGHNAIDTLSLFNVAFTYRYRGSRPHIFWVYIWLSEGQGGVFVAAGLG